jgi:cytochrome b561
MTVAAAVRSGFSYDPRTIRLHWIAACLVIVLWCLGQTIDWFPRGTPRSMARSFHILFGAILVFVMLARIYWRSGSGRRLPDGERGVTQGVATFIHVVLYLVVISTLVAGIANVWVRGETLFLWIKVPAWDPANKELRHQVEDVHALLANTVLFLALMHAGAAIVHHYILRDGVLRRMLPWLKPRQT